MQEIHIALADDSSQLAGGAGTAENPFRVLPNNAEDFDHLMIHRVNPSGARVVNLRPGVFHTRGCWRYAQSGYSMFPRTVTLRGAGSDRTTLALADPVLETGGETRPETMVLQIGEPWQARTAGIEVSGLTLDGRAANSGCLVTNGLMLWGDRAIVRDVVVTGLRGSKAKGHEAFGIHLRDHPTLSSGGARVSDCRVIHHCIDKDDYTSPVYVGYTGSYTQSSVIERCSVVGISHDDDTVTRLAYSLQVGTVIRDCHAEGVSCALYSDTGPVRNCIVSGLAAYNVRHWAICLQNSEPVRDVIIENSFFGFEVPPPTDLAQIGLVIAPRNGGTAENVTLQNCVFTAAPVGRPFIAASLAPGARGVRLVNCALPPGTTRYYAGQMDPEPLIVMSHEVGRVSLPQFVATK